MESTTFDIVYLLNERGCAEFLINGFIKSKFINLLKDTNINNELYFNLLISLSEYSFCNSSNLNNIFNYDYSNDIDYNFINSNLTNHLINSPKYNYYCKIHSNNTNNCLDCLERYRIITKNLIPIINYVRKDLCSIYFIDILYDLIRFENNDVYSLITHLYNSHSDGSNFKNTINQFGKKNILKLFKMLNKPFRRIDYKFVFKKYFPLLYRVYLYCDKHYIDNKDNIYDYMLTKGLSLFKTVPSKYIVVGYIDNQKCPKLDIIKTYSLLNFSKHINKFKIASHELVEGLNFGFYEHRLNAYKNIIALDNIEKLKLKKLFSNFNFTGVSVFSGDTILSNQCIIIGFLKQSENTFQNFRLDIHIDTFITNNSNFDYLRFIKHSKWK